ncbi:MAG: F0F1 ATP synthase subunit B [Parvibaculales bacterium]
MFDASFFVAIAFFGVIGLFVYFKVPRKIIAALDARSKAIADELEEARRLREDAQNLFAKYQRNQRDGEREAENILALAKKEAESLAKDAEKNINAEMKARTRIAEEKIAQAEAQIIQKIQKLAAETAIKGAEDLLSKKLSEKQQKKNIDKTIRELSDKLH